MVDTTKSSDIYAKIEDCFRKMNLKMGNLVGVTTYSAPAMVGRINGVQSKIAESNNLLIRLKCIIHQENLCSKFGIESAKPFSDFIMKVINKVIFEIQMVNKLIKKLYWFLLILSPRSYLKEHCSTDNSELF